MNIHFIDLLEQPKIKFQNPQLQLFMKTQSFIHMLQDLLQYKKNINYPLYKQGWEQYIQDILQLIQRKEYTSIRRLLSTSITYNTSAEDSYEEGKHDAQQDIIKAINNVNDIYASV